MRKWAVGFLSYHDNMLIVELVDAPNWREAIGAHTKARQYDLGKALTLDEIKQEFFDGDAALDVVEIT